jgi:hypothetical protein
LLAMILRIRGLIAPKRWTWLRTFSPGQCQQFMMAI